MINEKKKVAIIGTVGLPAKYGGFETLANYLTLFLNKKVDFFIFCQKTKKHEQLQFFNNSRLIYLPFYANGIQSIIYDIYSLTLSWFKYDTLLILGTPGSIIIPFLKIFKKTKTVINFGGLEWKREKWSKIVRAYLKFTERIAVNNATIVVADNEYFCSYIKESYGKSSVLIEYGGDHALKKQKNKHLISKFPFLNKSYDLSVSRAQTDNNLHMVIEAYKSLPNRNLVLISNYSSSEYGKKIKKQYGNLPNVFLQDSIYDIDELNAIRTHATIYIHSHSFCGTAPSLVEAMNLGLPVIALDIEANKMTTEKKSIYFLDSTSLAKVVKNTNTEKLNNLKYHMKEIGNRRYNWNRICNMYYEQF